MAVKRDVLTVVEAGRLGGLRGGPRSRINMSPAEASDIARRAGIKGGAARAVKLSARRRKEIAKKAAAARWAKTGAKEGQGEPTAGR